MALASGVGFLGGGVMTNAILKGLLKSQPPLIDAKRVYVSDVVRAALSQLQSALPDIHVTQSNVEVAQNCEILFLCVKPHIVEAVLKQLEPILTAKHLIISIAAGITIGRIEDLTTTKKVRVIRVMPNIAATVNLSGSGFALGKHATDADAELVKKFFTSVGVAHRVDEKLIDSVTGLSGSGTAYVLTFIQALADGGVRVGIPRDIAISLATQTVLGTAKLLQESNKHPTALADSVSTPGGTTIAGLHALENGRFRGTVMDAVVAATQRAKELQTPISKL